MSGHSKWSTIKRKKGLNDAARGKIFSKLSRIITTAVCEGGNNSDPETNFKLRLAIERAKAENMPKDTIDRAITKAIGGQSNQAKEVIYEAFIPQGIVMLIEANTDNNNRTHYAIKHIVEQYGGKMGGVNSVLHLFDKCGMIIVDKNKISQDELLSLSERLSAIDIIEEEEDYIIYIPFEMLGNVRQVMPGIEAKSIEIFFKPKLPVTSSDGQTVINLAEALEGLEDVMKVYSNIV